MQFRPTHSWKVVKSLRTDDGTNPASITTRTAASAGVAIFCAAARAGNSNVRSARSGYGPRGALAPRQAVFSCGLACPQPREVRTTDISRRAPGAAAGSEHFIANFCKEDGVRFGLVSRGSTLPPQVQHAASVVQTACAEPLPEQYTGRLSPGKVGMGGRGGGGAGRGPYRFPTPISFCFQERFMFLFDPFITDRVH
jgi:hypothetical protein